MHMYQLEFSNGNFKVIPYCFHTELIDPIMRVGLSLNFCTHIDIDYAQKITPTTHMMN